MKLSEIKIILQNKIITLEWSRQVAVDTWELDRVFEIDAAIAENQITLNELN